MKFGSATILVEDIVDVINVNYQMFVNNFVILTSRKLGELLKIAEVVVGLKNHLF